MSQSVAWVGTAEAAGAVGVTTRTIYGFLNRGELIGYRFGRVIRIRQSDLDAFIDAHRIEPGDLDHLDGNSPHDE